MPRAQAVRPKERKKGSGGKRVNAARCAMNAKLAQDLLNKYYESGKVNDLGETDKDRYLKTCTAQVLA
ncbi:hypothetical protein SARC_07339 [Sphaeroforma arctica JP610]|uniref:Uncharacterized protein n=1 Tax=Sphaeroforma arctica JP610 TaxID=667725 RepID=A0A0L0FUG5_9EUKA|nr:hypothetical protein SARC_07339 [Sphaeroforma arctica JP610]KNC80304.1 hypothetical protein SARC_07339 [Sphaeroforma arctica JP610]|eukprot:XP_014154206.1 hypothetical protein SARC_07339 [Sphaeroforma arctica JP610]